MTTLAFDIRNPDAVVRELKEANLRLAREADVPGSIVELIQDVAGAIADADTRALESVDPYLWIDVQSAALRAQRAAHLDDDRERRRAVRISLEEIRFLLARLAERHPVGEDQPIKEVLQWLDTKLPVPQRRKADLLGVGERTYQRWVSPSETAAPEAEQELRARLVARITAQLRHFLTGPGVVEWFETPKHELEDVAPIDLLFDATSTERLLEIAVSGRSFSAA
jgi:uncharacterized protein (DUF2384 family)